MLKAAQAEYIIELIVQDNRKILTQLNQDGITEEQKKTLKDRLELSDFIFQSMVSSLGVEQSDVSINDRILLVEDTLNMLNLMRSILNNIGFKNIDTARDGVEAWELIQNNSEGYGLILSDWEMPKMDGLQLLIKVRSDENFKDCPFIIISSTSQLEKVKMAISAGVTDYMVKPISQKNMENKVVPYLAKKKDKD